MFHVQCVPDICYTGVFGSDRISDRINPPIAYYISYNSEQHKTMVSNKKKGKNKNAAKVQAATSSSSCYHGSTEEQFDGRGEYLKAVEEFFYRSQKQGRTQDSRTVQMDAANLSKTFSNDYIHLMKDPGFGKFVFAWCTREYLKSKLKKPVHRNNVKVLLALGLLIQYHYVPMGEGKDVGLGSTYMDNISKYNRDLYTDRGIINCLTRGTPCKCMNGGKADAKKMEKLGYCFGCESQFPKETLFLCAGCHDVKYHNRDCQIQDWPEHKVQCKEKQRLQKEREGNGDMLELVNQMKTMAELKGAPSS